MEFIRALLNLFKKPTVKPVQVKPVAKKPVKKPIAEKPATDHLVNQPEKPTSGKPVVEPSIERPVEPSIETPVTPTEPSIETPVTPTEPSIETHVTPTEPSIETPAEPSVDHTTRPVEPVETNDDDFLNDIVQMPLNRDEFLNDTFDKKQIYLHHTAGNASAKAVIRNWDADDRGRIATCVVISNTGAKDSEDGEIVQAFSSKYWAYHLGVKTSHFDAMGLPYISLDKFSIGVELCAWGPLKKSAEGKFYNYVGGEVPEDQVCELDEPFRGFTYYHKYSEAQLRSLKNLLLYWNKVYDIPLTYNEDIWNLNEKAYTLEPGVYTHCSVRPDKTDVFPQPELIEMLKSLV